MVVRKFNLHNLLCCPVCKGNVDKELKCLSCGNKYRLIDDVYMMIDPELSKKEWQWDEKIFNRKKINNLLKQYKNYLNKETKNAQRIWLREMKNYIAGFHNIVVDFATGLGTMLENLLESNADFTPIATDVDPNVLIWTKMSLNRYKKKFFTVNTDVKHFAFRDNSIDYITSLGGLNNIPNTVTVLKELHRVLKYRGKLVVMHSFVEENSKSEKLARQHNLERAFIAKYLIKDLTKIGFKNVKINIVASAIWAENPMDLLPVAGDTQYFAIVEADK